ncbi:MULTISPECIES: glycine-rich domain-containing protein [unclassified Streptomyces]|uniref:glycine-rich domain-containing protein n=1 Tax=unclassified Streptomyces TaxID=2593676 RepID=UPI003415188E
MATTVASPRGTDSTTGPVRSVREVVSADLWDKQVGLLQRDYPYDSIMAARVLGQGYAYLLTAMRHRGASLGLAPSKLVDIGVHTIILDTIAYAELCEKHNGGHFLHHVPKAEMKNDGSVMKTAHRIAADGWEVDLSLWADAADCGPCHPGNDSH